MSVNTPGTACAPNTPFREHVKSVLVLQGAPRGLLDSTVLYHAVSDDLAYYALYLYVTAFHATTDPPPIQLPFSGSTMSSNYTATSLQPPGAFCESFTAEDCPPAFRPPIYSWSELAPNVQRLPNPHRLDVARLICGLPLLNSPTSGPELAPLVHELAYRIRSIAYDMHSRGVFSGTALGVPTTQEASQPSASQKRSAAKPRRKRKDIPVIRDPPRTRSSSAKVNGAAAIVKPAKPVNHPKPRKARVVKQPLLASQKSHNKRSEPTTGTLPIKPLERETLEWRVICPPEGGSLMAPGAPKIIPLHSSLKPRIWAASREELCRILPEYAQTQDDIVFENRETPTLFVDGAVWPEDRWDGGKTIDLSMVRVFRRRLPDLSPPYPEGDMLNAQYGLIMGAPGGPVAPEAIPAVVEHEDGMFRFVSEGPSHGTGGHSSHSNGHPTPTPPQPAYDGPPTATLTALAPRDAPPEIEALLGSQIAGVPVSLVLCRSAALTPFALPEGCGCAFLGFFFITDVRVQVDDVSWEVLSDDPPITLVNGRKTWRFRLEWTPGGEGEDADTTNSTLPVPWWMEASAPSLPSARQIIEIEPLLHPYTLLPLHLLSPPEQIVCSDADVQAPRGWHCLSCGKLNLQQNLCYQKCDCCSASNGLSPLSVEYVRQPRGTDPIAFPWDRHPESVPCTSTEGRDGLRIFSYVLGAAVAVHHVFTCNRPGPQSEPTELFRALQADTELISELGAKGRGGGGIGPYYGCKFTGASGRQAAAGVWSPDAPDSVRRARDLMRLRGRVDPASVDSDVVINTLTICAWRTAGNKKGCVFSAERSPVVLLCLGADVEVTFWRRATVATKGVQPAQVVSAPVRGITPRSKLAEKTPAGDSDDEYIDEPDTISAPVRRSRSSSKSLSGSAKNKRLEEALMVTLVHGDLLVVHGANFEYSMKRTGMSIVLFGQQ